LAAGVALSHTTFDADVFLGVKLNHFRRLIQ
jgi:hypothetical protein